MNELARRTTVLPDGRVRIQENAVRGYLRILLPIGIVGNVVNLATTPSRSAPATVLGVATVIGALVMLVRVQPSRIEVGPDDVLVVNPSGTTRLDRRRIVEVRATSVLVAVALAFVLDDGSRVRLVGVSRWARQGLAPPAWFRQAHEALAAWVRYGTRPPTEGGSQVPGAPTSPHDPPPPGPPPSS